MKWVWAAAVGVAFAFVMVIGNAVHPALAAVAGLCVMTIVGTVPEHVSTAQD